MSMNVTGSVGTALPSGGEKEEAMGKKAAISTMAIPLVAAAAIGAWIRARWTRRVAAKGTLRVLRWRPGWVVLKKRPVRKGLLKGVAGVATAGTVAARHGVGRKLKKMQW
jgi:hypothetical protein